jgi:hydrogenase maturation factor HypF (carbamoyltransferase family)
LPADRVEMVKSGKGWGGIILLQKIEHTKEIGKRAKVGGKGASSSPRRSRSDQVNGVHERLLTSSLLQIRQERGC